MVTGKRGLSLHVQILIALGAGLALGIPLNALHARGLVGDNLFGPITAIGEGAGKLFLSLLSMIVVPLVFTSIASAITGLRAEKNLRRLGLITTVYFLSSSMIAICVGLVLSNLIRPGDGVDYQRLMAGAKSASGALPAAVGDASASDVLSGLIFRTVPPNILEAARDNRNMLSVILVAMLFGLFVNRLDAERSERLSTLIEDFYALWMRMTHAIIALAPYGIFGYVVFVSATTGTELFGPLAKYMAVVFCGLLFHGVVVLPLLVLLLARRSPLALFRAVSPALATAFSTASSSGTLPLTIECVTERAGISKRVASFVLSLGSTINMDGTALYEAAAVLFIAQMLGDLSVAQQFVVAITALVASIGAAGIPHAGTVMMVIVLQAVGLPTEAVLAILAVDRILDMLRTTINVWSDVTASAVVERLAGATAGPTPPV